MSENQEENLPVSPLYLAYIFIIGFGLVAVFIYGGYVGWSLLYVSLVGALFQTLFRVGKQLWRSSFESNNETGSEQVGITAKAIAIIYITMIFVTALWYGVGYLIAWLFA